LIFGGVKVGGLMRIWREVEGNTHTVPVHKWQTDLYKQSHTPNNAMRIQYPKNHSGDTYTRPQKMLKNDLHPKRSGSVPHGGRVPQTKWANMLKKKKKWGYKKEKIKEISPIIP
jgi:hypothetical protein